MADYYSGTQIDIAHYWRIVKSAIRSSYIKVISSAILIAVLAFLFTLTLQPLYSATATMHIAPPKSAVFDIQEIFFNRRDPAFRETQVGILRSRALLNKVVERLELHRSPDFVSENSDLNQSESYLVNRTAASLQRSLSVLAQRDSYLYNISIILPNAKQAAEVANVLAEEYIQFVKDTEVGEQEQSDSFLQERLVLVNKDLRDAEVTLQEFKEKQGILGDSEASGGFANQELDLVSKRLLDAKQKRLELESLYQKVLEIEKNKGDFQGIPAIKNDSLVQSIRSELVSLSSQRGELSKRYGPAHQKIIDINSQIASTNYNLKKQVSRLISGFKSEYELAKQNEDRLSQSAEQSKTNIQSLGRKQSDLLSLEQEVQSKREIYQMILGRLNQSKAAGTDSNDETFVVDPAVVSLKPISSKSNTIIMLAGMFSLFAGFCIALLGELFNNTVKIDKDVETKLSETSLGIVPMIDEGADNKVARTEIYKYFLEKKSSAFSEAIRTIRSSLLLSSVGLKKRRVLFTSTQPGEGKTVMAINTAIAFGKLEKTILIDCDLRRPSVDWLISGSKKRHLGLSDICSGQATLKDSIFHLKDQGIDVMCAGSFNPSPQELFCSTVFTKLLAKLSDVYDVIVIDTPPSLGLSDTSLIASHVDQVVFVVKSGDTSVTKVRSSLMALKKANAPVSGVIVNQVISSDLEDSYYYQYGYGVETGEKVS